MLMTLGYACSESLMVGLSEFPVTIFLAHTTVTTIVNVPNMRHAFLHFA